MKSVFDKLGLYDFLGFIIPGFLGILSIQVLYTDLLNISFPIKINDGFMDSVIFISASYFFGIILHEIGQFIQEKLLKKLWSGLPSERFLLADDKTCPESEKEIYYNLAQEVFGIEKNQYDRLKSQFAFNNFFTGLQVAGKDERVQLFNTYYGMYRNFFTGSLLSFLVCLFYLFAYIFNIIMYNKVITNDYSFLITGVVFFIFMLTLYRRTRRFGEIYVKYVFREFAEYYRNTQIIKSQKNDI